MNLFGAAAAGQLSEDYHLAIVTAEALSVREAPFWPEVQKRIVRHMSNAKRRVLFPQDDYTFSARLDELVVKAKIDAVWSPLPRDEALYPKAVHQGVSFNKCLTGYIEDYWLPRYSLHNKPFGDREVDLGQRVGAMPSSFGDVGIRKARITQKMAHEFQARSMRVDVSFDSKDVLLGDDWLAFLGNTRFTVSRKGGSSLADRKLRLTESLGRLRILFPSLPETTLFKLASKRGVIAGIWEEVSPRLFEAAAMGVCQILEDSDYLEGALTPWVHYIPLESNFSNVEEVFSFAAQTELVEGMIEATRNLLVNSGAYSYRSFVQGFYRHELGPFQPDASGVASQVDLDASTGMHSKKDLEQVKDYFEKVNPLSRARFGQQGNEAEAAYAGLMKHEILPESLITDWVGLGFHSS